LAFFLRMGEMDVTAIQVRPVDGPWLEDFTPLVVG